MPRWRPLQFLTLCLCAAATAAASNSSARAHIRDAALDAIEDSVQDGSLDANEALVLSLTRVLTPDELPADLRELAEAPLRCGTPVMQEIARRYDELPATTRAEIRRRMNSHPLFKATNYSSAAGHFVFSYETTGTNAVSAEDVDPANGIPDYVERVAAYFETSWGHEVDSLGFVAPDLQGQAYEVSFESMGSYGYTTLSATSPGGTRIVMHNSFLGFPPNEDPEGNAIGAAKVTAAHEFKHAIQYATTQWQENGYWPELDATWMEDIVYDQVNDYYNYLPNGSPISDPELGLDANGGGSYEDCVFQHWISETWGDSSIVALWDHRALTPIEPMLDSYEWLLNQFGTSFVDSWSDFTSWNYSTGARSLPGFGYEEASSYPSSTVSASFTSVPATHAGVVGHLAANFSEFTGFSVEPGTVTVRVQRQAPSTLRVAAIVVTRAGTWNLHPLDLTLPDETYTLPEALYSVDRVVLVVSNGATAGGSQAFSANVEEHIVLPIAQAQVDLASISFSVASGDSAGRIMNLRNVGAPGSVLGYRVLPMAAIPPSTQVAKDVTGSLLAAAVSTYEPGTSADLFFSVTNNTSDLEWLAGVEIAFPAGVRVDSTTNFVGGSAGDLVSNAAAGDSVVVSWLDANGSWGNVKNGETASAHVYVSYDPSLFGDLNLAWTIFGDGYGGGLHEVAGAITLSGPASPNFKLVSPVGIERYAIGDSVEIDWSAAGESKVRLELSRDGGATWVVLADSTANDGKYRWLSEGPASSSARVRVATLDSSRTDASAQNFWLYDPLPWVAVNPQVGAIASGSEITLGLGFDARFLAPAIYGGVIVIEHDGPQEFLELPLVVDVRSDATPTVPDAGWITLLGNLPNPFNPATKIHFELPTEREVRLEVFDASGRLVRRLVDGPLGAGDHYVDWASEDTHGHQVSSGIYFYTVRSGSEVARGKMTLLK